jgi:tetratricopeptide (TPR) repeat protein
LAKVFLSYDHEDQRRAASVATALEKAGHSVWWDQHIEGGAEYNNAIEIAVEDADVVVVLWSERSVRSAWVRDEAAEGRDSGKLVPVALDSAKPPMGFRQFQTIDLSGSRGSQNKSLEQLLKRIETLAQGEAKPRIAPRAAKPDSIRMPIGRKALAGLGGLVLLLTAGAGTWIMLGRADLPVVAVAPADSSAGSQALSRDLFVKLGSLPQVGSGKWQLVDAAKSSSADLLFKTAFTGSRDEPRANLQLLDGGNEGVLWSREFKFPAGGDADLRQHMSLTGARALECALMTREAGGLRPDLYKKFLTGCTDGGEDSYEDPHKLAAIMQSIVAQEPRFIPARLELIGARLDALNLARLQDSEARAARDAVLSDTAQLRRIAPHLPELKAVDLYLLPDNAYAKKFDLISELKRDLPGNAGVWGAEATYMQSVGRMRESVNSARRAAELNPLSPFATNQFILALAYSGQIDEARSELAEAERVWAGTGALRDVQFAFHLRFGDPKIAQQLSSGYFTLDDPYVQARLNPSPENVRRLVEFYRQLKLRREPTRLGGAVQEMGEFGQTDEVFDWLAFLPTDRIVTLGYVLFRPALAGVRSDPRFMQVAKRMGLLHYWRESGRWPDFCLEPNLPYDCKEVAKRLKG